jgi:hypothetical protein
MTLAQIVQYVRDLVKEESTDAGALLSDSGNLSGFVNDAAEQVVLDLLDAMPLQFCATEDINLVANTQEYTISAEYLQVYKVALNESGKRAKEIEIIDPIEEQFFMATGDTSSGPTACYFLKDKIRFVPIPSAAVTAYARLYLVTPEASSIAVSGPTMIPRVAHRLICYYAAGLAATMADADPGKFFALYGIKLKQVKKVWANRFQTRPRFVRPGITARGAYDGRDRALYDVDWGD